MHGAYVYCLESIHGFEDRFPGSLRGFSAPLVFWAWVKERLTKPGKLAGPKPKAQRIRLALCNRKISLGHVMRLSQSVASRSSSAVS